MMKAVGMKPISNVSHLRSPQSSFWASCQVGDKRLHSFLLGPHVVVSLGPLSASLGAHLTQGSCNAMWGLQDNGLRMKRCSPQELPTSCICPHSWSGWRRPGLPARSTSCPKTLRNSQSFPFPLPPFSTFPHIRPFSLLPYLMYGFALRHATTES